MTKETKNEIALKKELIWANKSDIKRLTKLLKSGAKPELNFGGINQFIFPQNTDIKAIIDIYIYAYKEQIRQLEIEINKLKDENNKCIR